MIWIFNILIVLVIGGMIIYGILYFLFQFLGFIFEVIMEWLFGGS